MKPMHITQARALLTDPARAADRPGARAIAWATLKSAAGQTHHIHRLTPPARITEPVCDLADFLRTREQPITDRIRARAAQHGIGPTGGDVA